MADYQAPDAHALDWVCRELGTGVSVVSTTRLVGGITASMDRVVLRSGAGTVTVVMRRWPHGPDHAPDLVAREAVVLAALADQEPGSSLVAPRLLASDPTGAVAGAPSTVMTHVPGQVQLAPSDLGVWVRRLAEQQAAIHCLAPVPTDRDPGWFSLDADRSWITDPGLRAEALDAATSPNDAARCFVHGDYQHFNVLWTDERISAVVDWPSAGMGDPGFDVGHCRLNLAVLFSTDLAEEHRGHYESAVGAPLDVGGDLRALLGWSPAWQGFIPVQVAGRAPVDLDGMAVRVSETIRRTLRRA